MDDAAIVAFDPGADLRLAAAGQPVGDPKRFWPKMQKVAQIPDVRIHDLRHTFASLLVSGGASLEMIGRLLGHTQIGTTQRYAHLIDAPLRAGVPGCDRLELDRVQNVLLEVARRGIPTIKGLAGDDAGATGVLVAARLLQDRFRGGMHIGDGLLPVLDGSVEDPKIVVVVPVDPFLGYISDLSKALGKDRTDLSQLRPDLVVVGIDLSDGRVRIKITPVEVKCRPTSRFSPTDAIDALDQAKALSSLLSALKHTSDQPKLWALAYQHLLLSIIGFGLRVYSQHGDVVGHAARWSEFHEQIARAVFDDSGCVEIDTRGRLIVLDDSPSSRPQDYDNDGFDETIIIGREGAGRVVAGDPSSFYDMVRARVSDWGLMPDAPLETASVDASKSSQPIGVVAELTSET